ncbi:MAG: hypothetical protein CSA86_04200 [Arcobacter sp.]|nr:MAG: hypothetical protein CSA86_04200 [Arcobacter sp.]
MTPTEQLIEVITFSYEHSTWVTWLVMFMGVFQSVRGFGIAFRDNKTYADMKANPDKTGIAQFYTGIVASILTVVIFFLPYLIQ